MVSRRVDLHAHTNVSDGTLTPAQLVERAKEAGLAALAITDHDHVGGLAEAREVGARLGVEIVPGIELSVEGPHGELHLLGYLFDDADARLLARLETLRVARERRAEEMVARLQAAGVAVTVEMVRAHAGEAASLGRPHVARALMDAGLVSSVSEAFDGYLSEGRPGYVPKEKLSPEEGIALVHAAGGVAVLAHPVTIRDGKAEAAIRALAAAGLDGIEVAHSKQAPDERARFAALAEELGLVQTGGSDFHGENKPDVALGHGRGGNVEVGYETLEALRRRKVERRR